MKKILCVIGTRPEAIKMAPVILALKQVPDFQVRVLATAQHREMLDEALDLFGIVPDLDLDIMRKDQQLAELTGRLLISIDAVLDREHPDVILAQGDTTTVLATALAAFYRKITFGHVEAGLRTGILDNPFPEEINRMLAGRLASLHFAPTERARKALLYEGVDDARIWVTGNTVIDALLSVADLDISHGLDLPAGKRIILLTTHRRENFGAPLEEIFQAVRTLLQRHDDLHVVYPVHPNPSVSEAANRHLYGQKGITLCKPLDYGCLVSLMKQSWLVMTDSGGLQEEAPALGKPVLVLRNETERQEAIEAGVTKLVGHDFARIVETVENLCVDDAAYRTLAQGASPFGDGLAASRIVAVLKGQGHR